MMKNILVTGSSGFIGSHIVEKLLESGKNIIGVDIDDSKTSNYDVNKDKHNFVFKK